MFFIYMKITMTPISKTQRARFYKYKNQNKLQNVFTFKKSDTFQKVRQCPLCFIYKKQDTVRYAIFHDLAFINKKHDTLGYVKFLNTKIQTLRKNQDNLRYIFIYKKPDTLR